MKFIVSLVAIVLVGSVIFVVLLELFLSGGGGEQQERTQKEAAPKKIEHATGIVSEVDTDEHTVSITLNNGKRRSFTYNPDKVKVTQDGKEVGPDAIDKGQTVRIKYLRGTTKEGRKEKFTPSIKILSGPGTKNGGEGTG
jgi:hypothetical protein